MASKILKGLARAGLLVSHRGAKGGYGLARPAHAISVADIIVALEGPIALTACIEHGPGECEIEALCPARANWQRINDAIREALEGITHGGNGADGAGGVRDADARARRVGRRRHADAGGRPRRRVAAPAK